MTTATATKGSTMTTSTTPNTYGTTLEAEYVGRRVERAPGQHHVWPHHLWRITLKRDGSEPYSFEYRMGVGHEQTKCGKPKPPLGRYEVHPQQTCGHVRCENAGWQPTPPTLYDALTALKADATHGASFSEWCGELGMNADSIKDRELYLRCQESEDASKRFFGADWSAIVEDEDYV